MDEEAYIKRQDRDHAEHEALCRRCGACCGSRGSDPCVNLAKGDDGKYFCRDYANRIGTQHTVSGNIFSCVPIRDVLVYNTPYEGCGYVE
ncbi:MAG: hypothetical protein WC515_01650 [Candidatus Omnitrophota bacterium]